jgi:hypothetical protein
MAGAAVRFRGLIPVPRRIYDETETPDGDYLHCDNSIYWIVKNRYEI